MAALNTQIVPDCAECVALAALLGQRDVTVCQVCGAELLGPDPRPPPEPLGRARQDVIALAARPAVRAQCLEPGAHGGSDEDNLERELLVDSGRSLARRASLRLAAMRRHPGEGPRFANIVEYAYFERGPALNKIESCAEQIARRFGRKGEFQRWRASETDRMELTDSIARIAFGNVLLHAATEAYEYDRWAAILAEPTVPAPMPKLSLRTAFARRVVEAWDQAKKSLEPEVL